MYHVSILLDLAGLGLCALVGWHHALIAAGYVAFSKSYSWMGIRLKKYPVVGWLSVALFQGGYTYMQGNMAASNLVDVSWFSPLHLEAMLFATLIIGGSYPLTQIYQHDEDRSRGDHTISLLLGIKGTFVFSSLFFATGACVAAHYFFTWYQPLHFYIFLVCLSPVVVYFSRWQWLCLADPAQASYRRAMWMTQLSAGCMILCFVTILALNNTSYN
jgi:1,4-dihydroxy-2-naphthoate octaprenyltransferase